MKTAFDKWIERPEQTQCLANGGSITILHDTPTGLVVERSQYSRPSERFGSFNFPAATFTFPPRSV